MGNDGRFIPGIYNWCDRWCERCAMTDRCRVFAREEESKKEDPEKDWSEVVADNFKETVEMLRKMADEVGLDLDATNEETEAYMAVEEAHDIITDHHPLNLLADQYLKLSRSWLESVNLKENPLKWEGLVNLGLLKSEEAEINLKSVEESIEVIEWFLVFIAVKIKRALMDQLDDFWDDYPDEERSDLGTAKIASIAINRSLNAWNHLLGFFPTEEEIIDIVGILEQLQRGLLEVFPNYPKFIRPGFD